MNKLIEKKEITESQIERGNRQLTRLGVLIDVLYALMIFRLFYLLPRPEVDHFDKTNMVEVFKDSGLNFLVLAVGITLVLIYWNQNNLMFNNLKRTDGKHAVITILSVFSLMLYLYFVRLDMELDGIKLALQMESITLALAGFLGIWGWYYANKNGLVSDSVKGTDVDIVYLIGLPEPIVALLTLPFAVFGPNIWTLAWLLLIPVSIFTKWIRNRMKSKPVS